MDATPNEHVPPRRDPVTRKHSMFGPLIGAAAAAVAVGAAVLLPQVASAQPDTARMELQRWGNTEEQARDDAREAAFGRCNDLPIHIVAEEMERSTGGLYLASIVFECAGPRSGRPPFPPPPTP